MADVAKCINANSINEIRAVTSCLPTGYSDSIVVGEVPANSDTIAEIQDKYVDRFDDINYYTLNGDVLGA